MQLHSALTRSLCASLAAVLLAVTTILPVARAGMIGTQQVVAAQGAAEDRARLDAALQRDDVRAQLQAFGVDPADARDRVASLSDAEVRLLADRAGELPAGSSALGAVIGATIFVFIVLLVTDILGYTDVFPFVTKTVN